MIFDLSVRYSALCFVLPQLTRVSAAMHTRPFFLTTTTVDIYFSHFLSSFLQCGVFFDHLLVAVTWEVDRQFGVLAFAFAFDYQPHAVFRMTHARSDLQSCRAARAARAAFFVRIGALSEIGGVNLSALPGEKLLHALRVIVSPALIIARSSRGRRGRGR